MFIITKRTTMKKTLSLLLTASLVLTACHLSTDGREHISADELFHEHDSALVHTDEFSDSICIKYAKGLKVEYMNDGIHVIISNPDPSAKMARPDTIVISTPAKRFICTTALQLGNFEVLGLEHRIVGMNSLRNIFSEKMKQQMANGRTVTIGKEGNFDLECVIATRPDYILVSASKHGGFEALKECGIPLIPHHGYKETDPLGQAEWIKLIGLLTGETRRANAVFSDIEKKYNTLKSEVQRACAKAGTLPTIASGRQMRDGWYVVGGRSYMAQIFKDAGARYVMQDNRESGGVTLEFESAYAKGLHADFWQTDGSFSGNFDMNTLADEDERYTTMDAYKKHQVIFCNLSQTPYRELAGVQPHFMLADFVKAMHPELLPGYTAKYYKILD